jgi:membrane-anchored glycerophosphoryl diester phosphodiesterase (GDPDase)
VAAGYNPAQNNALATISNFIAIILGLVGVIFLALIIYGGFLWMTASGNDKQVETAKNIISRAAIGLVIIILAYAITFFIIKLLP